MKKCTTPRVTLSAWFILCAMSGNAFGHGKSVTGGEWLPVVDKTTAQDIQTQIQSSPLGNEILVDYSGADTLEVLADDGKPFLRISSAGVQGNLDHRAWYRSQVAGERPLPKVATDNKDEPVWQQVSSNSYWGWYDKRLEKQDEHQEKWQISLKVGGKNMAITGHFKSLEPPKYKTLVRLDRASLKPIAQLSAMLINGPEPAIRFNYTGESSLTILDSTGSAMLRFSQQGVEAKVSSDGWQQLGRFPLASTQEWVNISQQPAYTWPDKRLVHTDAETAWSIPVIKDSNNKVQLVSGNWLTVKSASENQYIAANR